MDYDEKKIIGPDWFKKHVTYNSLGYRDHEHSLAKPKDTFRILVLGDSMTFGQGVDNLKDIIPKKLETYLNKTPNKTRFEVISFAHPGYHTDSELYDLYTNGFKFQPDLIFLSYYHNDIPHGPEFLGCNPTNKDLIEGEGAFNESLRRSALYQTINFRFNRLLEKLKRKPSLTDCINTSYASLGWEMQRVYLDAIRMASTFRQIKLMIGVIPLMFKLDEEHPIGREHSKLADYCKNRGVECIDFLETDFKGKKAEDYIFSKDDRHLNAAAAEIVSKSLYKKLQPLTTFNHLSVIHRIFSLRELLEESNLSKEVDKALGEIVGHAQNPALPIQLTDDQKKVELNLWKSSGNYIFNKTQFNSSGDKKVTTSRYTLDISGQFIDHVFSVYDPQSQKVITEDKLEQQDKHIRLTHALYRPGREKQVTQINYQFLGEKYADGSRMIFLEDGIPFRDPKMFFAELTKIPPNLEDIALEEAILNQFLYFYHHSWVRFVDAIINEIIKRNPNPMILRAIAKTYRQTNHLEKLDQIVQAYPLFNDILMGTAGQ
ncbi:MAG: SGNH/GDSL hydrolase family protein [Nitrospina sp.]|nr:SGNH/GDSL hydrolase family protein [Nitrospina sp.]